MTPFTLIAPAKINLALHVLGRRADGYHDLDSIVAFADVGDELTFSSAPAFGITVEGPFASALPAASGNIITRAHAAVAKIAKSRGKPLPPVAVHLLKNLPVASGIGGGSSNAATAMRGFLRLAGIDGLDDEIMAAALGLGADVPVCLLGKACRMQGVGERIIPLPDFGPLHAILVNPLVAVATPAVFRQLGLEPGQGFGQPITDPADPTCWRNDLAQPAIALTPVIADVLNALRLPHPSSRSGEGSERQRAGGAGAPGEGPHPSRAEDSARHLPHALRGEGRKTPFAGMSGSGATCFGVFASSGGAGSAARDLSVSRPAWWVRRSTLS